MKNLKKITISAPTTITAGGRKRWRVLIYLFIPIYVQCSEKNNAANAETFLLLGRRPVYSHHHGVISLIRLQGNLPEQINIQNLHHGTTDIMRKLPDSVLDPVSE
jgi:hypothetical protein